MQATRVTANLSVPDIGEARDFYTDYLGLSVEGFNMGWVARFQSPDGRAVVQLVTRDATAPQDSVISVSVGDGIEEAYEERNDAASRSSIRSLRNLGAYGGSSFARQSAT
jgi:catechol 2,3-dioxygenase-like lactoylglutathione lyase family enzyme